jgi:porphyrinogen peroxidase
MTLRSQPAILESVPAVARYIVYQMAEGANRAVLADVLRRLAEVANGQDVVVGIGPSLVNSLGTSVPGLREFQELSGHRVQVPSTPAALWCWVRGDDRGDLLHATRRLDKTLAPVLRLHDVVDAFRHRLGDSGHGRDLTGYEDGTENPSGDAAVQAALVQGQGESMDGSSFLSVQQWVHDFDAFEALANDDRDHHFGRRLSDNEELEDSPTWAHVKRTAQESFDPPAFMLRRSMPWMTGTQAGLMFVAFGRSHDAFEVQMRRMAGYEDEVTDAMFRISQPVTGSNFWCPPMRGGGLDLRQLGL